MLVHMREEGEGGSFSVHSFLVLDFLETQLVYTSGAFSNFGSLFANFFWIQTKKLCVPRTESLQYRISLPSLHTHNKQPNHLTHLKHRLFLVAGFR